MANEGEVGVPATVFRSWENWNTRTHSTVQYVGLDDGKKLKGNQEEDDEDEDEVDTDNRSSLRRSSQLRTPIIGEEKDQDRSEITGRRRSSSECSRSSCSFQWFITITRTSNDSWKCFSTTSEYPSG